MSSASAAEAASPVQVRDYLDMVAVALAAGARWWREQLGKYSPDLSNGQLDRFEAELCFSLAKLLLRNAQQGLSWRQWKVACEQRPDETLHNARRAANLFGAWFPLHTTMWLETTSDQVLVLVCLGISRDRVQIWPAVAA